MVFVNGIRQSLYVVHAVALKGLAKSNPDGKIYYQIVFRYSESNKLPG